MSKARTLADFISDGSEFADGTISVAEVSGAAPLASPTFTGTASGTFSGPLTGNVTGDLTGDVTGNVTGNLTGNVTGDVAGDIDLSAIAATISDTAVDIFVYDTRKDSDGGAWRKRTQHTSWYNETLNTATRGSRKEFPAVAVIVAESSQITIYDGDDPDLPMWMVFETGSGWNTKIIITTGAIKAVQMLNGLMAFANGNNSQGLTTVDFIEEESRSYTNVQNYGGIDTLPVSKRNSSGHTFAVNTYNHPLPLIVNNNINDVAMTVLPNAPIDASSGLPVPTIAVATDGGVSVIKDDGTVVDSSLTVGVSSVSFTENNALVYNRTDLPGSVGDPVQVQLTIPTADGFTADQVFGSTVAPASNKWNNPDVVGTSDDDFVVGSGGNNIGFNYISNEVNDKTSGMTVQVTSEFNSGWQSGDIKLATLSDTDDTNVTGSELVTNGTFDTDTSGWTAVNSTLSLSSGAMRVTISTSGLAYAYQAITTVAGKTYTATMSIPASNNPGNNYGFRIGTSVGANDLGQDWTGSPDASATITFTATGTTTYVHAALSYTAGQWAEFDNISVRLAEEDRSVNGNGLQVFGTVTKSAVASGADLVAYSGFSTSNYLRQPYNSDLDFGTGDFCVMGWVNQPNTNVQVPFWSGYNDGSNWARTVSIVYSGGLYVETYGSSGSNNNTTPYAIPLNTWVHFVGKREGSVMTFWINGEKVATGSSTADVSSSLKTTTIGATAQGTYPYQGSLALLRISATAPTAEQIKKIYEDEKVLFQEGAQATLYGSSDAVTALAYDDSTNLLHVGTSAGRSVFQGLRRVDNTTTAVGAAISASNGLVADE